MRQSRQQSLIRCFSAECWSGSLRMLEPRQVGDHFVLLPVLVVLKLLCLLVPEIVIYNTLQ